jgi:NAD(P)-dependent dehydrogenase (short-subunit alcohol dehydrogenase family)
VYARSEADDAGGRGMPILQDQVVLVTGAGAGIGRGTALAMAEAGAAVARVFACRGDDVPPVRECPKTLPK